MAQEVADLEVLEATHSLGEVGSVAMVAHFVLAPVVVLEADLQARRLAIAAVDLVVVEVVLAIDLAMPMDLHAVVVLEQPVASYPDCLETASAIAHWAFPRVLPRLEMALHRQAMTERRPITTAGWPSKMTLMSSDPNHVTRICQWPFSSHDVHVAAERNRRGII